MGIIDQASSKWQKDGALPLIRDGASVVLSPKNILLSLGTRGRFNPICRSELRNICDKIYNYGSDDKIHLESPSHYPDIFHDLDGKYNFHQPYVAEVNDCIIYGPEALGLAKQGRPIMDTAQGRRDSTEGRLWRTPRNTIRKLIFPSSLRSSKDSIEFACLLTSGHFPHWIVNELPRIQGLERYQAVSNVEPNLVLPTPVQDYKKQSLELLGVSEDRIIEWDGVIQGVDRLIVPTIQTPELKNSTIKQKIEYDLHYKLPSPSGCEWVRNQLLETVRRDELEESRRLFVSRQDVESRNIVNRAAVIETLEQMGFETVVPGNHSFEKQLKLFSNADVVVGAHGGALANLMFVPRSARIVEIFGDKIKPTFYLLAKSRGLNYEPMFCESVGEDIRVDVTELVSKIDSST